MQKTKANKMFFIATLYVNMKHFNFKKFYKIHRRLQKVCRAYFEANTELRRCERWQRNTLHFPYKILSKKENKKLKTVNIRSIYKVRVYQFCVWRRTYLNFLYSLHLSFEQRNTRSRRRGRWSRVCDTKEITFANGNSV